MERNLKRLLVLVLGLMLVAAVFTVTRSDVVAQIRAALIKNVDEPWRTPWETKSQFLPSGGGGGCFGTSDCFNYTEGPNYVRFDLRPVPAGKRWVVQSATGGLTGGSARLNNIQLLNSRSGLIYDGAKWIFGGPFQTGYPFEAAVFASSVTAVFGPGEVPTVYVTATPSLSGYSVIIFNGYLIDATN